MCAMVFNNGQLTTDLGTSENRNKVSEEQGLV